MTNKEKYRQAFSAIQISEDFSLEVIKMKKINYQRKIKILIASAAAFVIIGGGATAYAADVGGIQRTIQLWTRGDQTQATIEFDGAGNYNMSYTDHEGNVKTQSGGGIAFEADGTERPLTPEELMEEMASPEVEYEDDGSVWVYWFDQKVDITDKFENDVCYVKLVGQDKTLYLTVEYGKGYSTSSEKYISPGEP